jgi:hypothetical protein
MKNFKYFSKGCHHWLDLTPKSFKPFGTLEKLPKFSMNFRKKKFNYFSNGRVTIND